MRTGPLLLVAAVTAWGCPGDDDGRETGVVSTTLPPPGPTSGPATATDTGGDDTGVGTGMGTGMATGNDDDDDTGSTPLFDVPMSADTGETMPCKVQEPMVTYVEPILIFVLDKSGSMSINQFDAGPAGTITRWNALHNTVSYLLTTYDSSIAFGMKLFPSANGCNVNPGLDVDPALNNEAAIIAAMPPPGADLNNGGTSQTPVMVGVQNTSTVMQTYDPATPKAVLLLLDGGVSSAQCPPNTFAGTEAAISELWNTYGIPVYVVGVDISAGTVADMNAYALAGGVPTGNPAEQFYNATDTAQLDMVMDEIVGEVLSCDIALDPEPEFPELTEVSVGGVQYNEIDQAACEAGSPGWYWASQYDQITLCGMACDEFLNIQTANVEFFCPAG